MTATLEGNVLLFSGDSFASGTIAPAVTAAPGAGYRWRVRGPGILSCVNGPIGINIVLGGVTRWTGGASDQSGTVKDFVLPAGLLLDGPPNGALTLVGGGGSSVIIGSIAGVEKVPVV